MPAPPERSKYFVALRSLRALRLNKKPGKRNNICE